MGIRLVCPNGHKLHIKTYLAGKRGICPKCGASFVIPPAAAGEAADSATPATAAPPAAQPTEPPPAEPPLPETEAASPPAAEAVPPSLIDPPPAEPPPPESQAASPPAAEAVPPQFVNPPPSTPPAESAPPAASHDATLDTAPPSDVPQGAANIRYLVKRRRRRRTQVVMTIWLLAAAIVLAGLLVWVLVRGVSQTSAMLQQPPAHLAEIGPPPYVAEAGGRLLWEASPRPTAC